MCGMCICECVRVYETISHRRSSPDHDLALVDPNADMIYNNIWADNADVMSIRYTGTGALKTDFTRTGKRSVKVCVKGGDRIERERRGVLGWEGEDSLRKKIFSKQNTQRTMSGCGGGRDEVSHAFGP